MNDLFASPVRRRDLGPPARPPGRRGRRPTACSTSPTAPSTPRSAPLLLAAHRDGLVRVAYDVEDHDAVLAALGRPGQPAGARGAAAGSTWWPASSTSTSPGAGALRRPARPAAVPASGATVLRAPARRSPTGTPRATPQVAAAAGNPQAVRAVGSACATNPLPVVVPCHRVRPLRRLARRVPRRCRRQARAAHPRRASAGSDRVSRMTVMGDDGLARPAWARRTR